MVKGRRMGKGEGRGKGKKREGREGKGRTPQCLKCIDANVCGRGKYPKFLTEFYKFGDDRPSDIGD